MTMTETIGRWAAAAIATLALMPSPAAAKPVWSCQYAKDRVVMTASMMPDPAPPGQSQPASTLTLKGNLQLALTQTYYVPGQPLTDTGDGSFSLKGYIVDNGAVIIFSPERQIASSEWTIERREPSGRWTGMFMNRPVADGIGRPMTAAFNDLTGATPPEYLHFRLMLPPKFYETKKYFARVPVAEFKALHAKGVAKAQSATSTTLAKC
jgi:hypothetical protein